MELGTVYATLGSKVVLVEALDSILAGADPDLARPVVAYAKKAFKEVRLKTKVGKMATSGKQIKVEMEVDGQERRSFTIACWSPSAACRTARISAWRTPAVSRDEKGFIKVNEKQQTDDPAIYAIGDVAGGVLLAHKATREGRVAVEVITGQDSAFSDVDHPGGRLHRPGTRLVRLDRSGGEAEGHQSRSGEIPVGGFGPRVVVRPHRRLDQADHRSGNASGFWAWALSGAGAGELIAEGVLAVEMGATAKDLALSVHPHPTLSETLMEAAEVFYGHATHTLRASERTSRGR